MPLFARDAGVCMHDTSVAHHTCLFDRSLASLKSGQAACIAKRAPVTPAATAADSVSWLAVGTIDPASGQNSAEFRMSWQLEQHLCLPAPARPPCNAL
jgi:hypothetical protein